MKEQTDTKTNPPTSPPYNLFYGKGFDIMPVISWLRICPYNSNSKRWHVPMAADINGKRKGLFIFHWLRDNQMKFKEYINIAMNEKRGLFADDALEFGLGNFWIVTDPSLQYDPKLLSTDRLWDQAETLLRQSRRDDYFLLDENIERERTHFAKELRLIPYSKMSKQNIVELGQAIRNDKTKNTPQIIESFLSDRGLHFVSENSDLDKSDYDFSSGLGFLNEFVDSYGGF